MLHRDTYLLLLINIIDRTTEYDMTIYSSEISREINTKKKKKKIIPLLIVLKKRFVKGL